MVSEDDWGDEPERDYPNIIEFIEARLKEALSVAWIVDPEQRQPRWCFGPRLPDGTYVLTAYGPMVDAFGTVNLRAATHAAYFDPTWVQRDVAAKRLILVEHRPHKTLDAVVCETCHAGYPAEFSELSEGEPFPCPTLRALACGYDWHRDFNPAWRQR